MEFSAKHTLYACYLAYITQAAILNLPPLLFVTFQNSFGLPLSQLSVLITVVFGVQIAVDLVAAKYVDRIGYRRSAQIALGCSTAGFLLLGTLPFVMDPFWGICTAMTVSSVGGGILEVLVSPLVDAIPGDAKVGAMSLLHAFYCIGYVATVLLSTLYFVTVGTQYWPILAFLWALLPIFDIWLFGQVPMYTPPKDVGVDNSKRVFASGAFWILCILMICAGAAEQAVSQWSSLFAETGLGVSKTLGDLLGPCAFASLMALSRILIGKLGDKLSIRVSIGTSALLCIASYLLMVFAPHPILSLVGCAISGFSVGVFWPGVISRASQLFPLGGTLLFALLAFCGDLGCAGGPFLVGIVSDYSPTLFASLSPMKQGIFVALIFPIMLLIGILLLRDRRARASK